MHIVKNLITSVRPLSNGPVFVQVIKIKILQTLDCVNVIRDVEALPNGQGCDFPHIVVSPISHDRALARGMLGFKCFSIPSELCHACNHEILETHSLIAEVLPIFYKALTPGGFLPVSPHIDVTAVLDFCVIRVDWPLLKIEIHKSAFSAVDAPNGRIKIESLESFQAIMANNGQTIIDHVPKV